MGSSKENTTKERRVKIVPMTSVSLQSKGVRCFHYSRATHPRGLYSYKTGSNAIATWALRIKVK